MSWITSIFSPDVISKSVDAIIDSGDALVYTDEEKAQAKQLSVETKMKMLPLFEPFKIAQRLIAMIVIVNFFLAFWVGVSIWYFVGKSALSQYMDLVVAFQLGWIALSVISFYFGGGFVESMNKGKKK